MCRVEIKLVKISDSEIQRNLRDFYGL